MKKIKKYCLIIFLILILLSNISQTYAVNISDTSSLEISFITENNTTPMGNVKIKIYKLASYSYEDFSITWDEVYNDYMIDLAFAEDDEIISTASNINEFIKENNMTADYEIITNSSGIAEITFDNGIYLICGEKTVKNGIIYTPNPFIIQMPYTNEDGELVYNVSVELKYDRVKQPDQRPADPGPSGSDSVPSESEDKTNTGSTPSRVRRTDRSGLFLPLTGDMLPIIVGIIILIVVLLNIIVQIIFGKKRKK